MAKKVYIGVGHGGSDPGAVAYGRKEKDLALDIAMACKNELVRNGVSVKISRETDSSVWLEDRIAECNKYAPDCAVDIHLNAGGGDGAEVFHSKADSSDDALAQNILNEIIAIGQNSRGLKTRLASNGTDYFGFIRQIKCKSALVECAFLDNATDVKIVDTLEERKAMGVAIAKGILKTLGVVYKKPTTTTTTNTTTKIEEGDLVSIKSGAKYYDSGDSIPSWVQKQKWYVTEVSGNRVVVDKSESGKNAINSPIDVKYLSVAKKATTPKSYKKGDKVNLTKKSLYSSSTDKTAKKTISGTYYIYDGEKINGKYRITNKASNCGKKPVWLYVTGYVAF